MHKITFHYDRPVSHVLTDIAVNKHQSSLNGSQQQAVCPELSSAFFNMYV